MITCAYPGCKSEAYVGETLCTEHIIGSWVDDYMTRKGLAWCKHPEACKARARNPGDTMPGDWRHCECVNER